MVLTDLHLAGRAQHSVAGLSAHLARRDLHAAGHHRADGRERHQIADVHVGRTATDLQRLAVSEVHVDQTDLVRIGVLTDVENLRDHDPVETFADALDRLELHAQVGELHGDLLRVALDRGELTEPGEQNLHRGSSILSRAV